MPLITQKKAKGPSRSRRSGKVRGDGVTQVIMALVQKNPHVFEPVPGAKLGKAWTRLGLPANARDPEHKVTLKGLGVSWVRMTQDEVTRQGLNSSDTFWAEDIPEAPGFAWNTGVKHIKACDGEHEGPCVNKKPEPIGGVNYRRQLPIKY